MLGFLVNAGSGQGWFHCVKGANAENVTRKTWEWAEAKVQRQLKDKGSELRANKENRKRSSS